MKKRLPRQRNGKLHLHNDNIGTTNNEYDMSELKLVRGNTFAIKIKVKAYTVDGTLIQDFDISQCTDITVSLRRNMYAVNDVPYKLLTDNDMRVVFPAALQRTGCYNLEVKGKLGDIDWRFYDLCVFHIVESNDEAEIPQSSIIDEDFYLIEGAYVSIPVAKGDKGDKGDSGRGRLVHEIDTSTTDYEDVNSWASAFRDYMIENVVMDGDIVKGFGANTFVIKDIIQYVDKEHSPSESSYYTKLYIKFNLHLMPSLSWTDGDWYTVKDEMDVISAVICQWYDGTQYMYYHFEYSSLHNGSGTAEYDDMP